MVALLPMYDWPEVQAETDALWRAIREGLRARGVEAPANLLRPGRLPEDWLSPDLLLSQTCGLPFARSLRGRVDLVAGADHGLPDLAPGTYRSRVVVRAEDDAQGIEGLRGRVLAINSADSQSGAGSIRRVLAALPQPVVARVVETGAHRESIRAVAEGRADAAAIDAVGWELALRHDPLARRLRVVASTPETAGLPFITRRGGPVEALRTALAEAVEAVGPSVREAILLRGIVHRENADFDEIACWDAEAPALA